MHVKYLDKIPCDHVIMLIISIMLNLCILVISFAELDVFESY